MDFSALNSLDYAILIMTAISVLFGIFRGFLREIISLIVWAVAFVLAYVHGKTVGDWFSFIGTDLVRQIFGSALIFFTIIIICGVIKHFVFKAFSVGHATFLDRMLGAFYGVFRAYAVVILAMILLDNTAVPDQDWYQVSAIRSYLQSTADSISGNVGHRYRHEAKELESNDTSPTTTQTPATTSTHVVPPATTEPTSPKE